MFSYAVVCLTDVQKHALDALGFDTAVGHVCVGFGRGEVGILGARLVIGGFGAAVGTEVNTCESWYGGLVVVAGR